jgi:hypothetical protein
VAGLAIAYDGRSSPGLFSHLVSRSHTANGQDAGNLGRAGTTRHRKVPALHAVSKASRCCRIARRNP